MISVRRLALIGALAALCATPVLAHAQTVVFGFGPPVYAVPPPPDDYWQQQREADWRAHEWREHEWHEHEWREHEWRQHEWQEDHDGY